MVLIPYAAGEYRPVFWTRYYRNQSSVPRGNLIEDFPLQISALLGMTPLCSQRAGKSFKNSTARSKLGVPERRLAEIPNKVTNGLYIMPSQDTLQAFLETQLSVINPD